MAPEMSLLWRIGEEKKMFLAAGGEMSHSVQCHCSHSKDDAESTCSEVIVSGDYSLRDSNTFQNLGEKVQNASSCLTGTPNVKAVALQQFSINLHKQQPLNPIGTTFVFKMK